MMFTLLNRAAYVEVRKGRETIFRKGKPPEGGISRHLLSALKIQDDRRGVYAIRSMAKDDHDAVEAHIHRIGLLDGRVPSDQEELNKSLRVIVNIQKEVDKVA